MAKENFWEALKRHAQGYVEANNIDEFEEKEGTEPYDSDAEDLYFTDGDGQRYRLVGVKAVLQRVDDPASPK